MVSLLIGAHAFLGELAGIGFLWILIELLNPTIERINRAKIISLIAVILFLSSWLIGGYYYVNTYGANVKPIIKEGPEPWAHSVIMETKEHIFLFLPFLAIFASAVLWKNDKVIQKDNKLRIAVILLSGLIFLLAFAIGAMGYLISSGARAGLEAKII
ncbi:MAG TPA: hypothetical protein VJJ23_01705 [Candidatus Nanoarchaeia archaeon]|nr:hypothetical protein [Candidatus Nanoarchaeia archaeon]